MAPSHIEADEDGNAAALWVQPQIIGEADKSGRPRPNKADLPEVRIPADIIVVAIGQGIEILGFQHEIKVELDIPAPRLNNRAPHGLSLIHI